MKKAQNRHSKAKEMKSESLLSCGSHNGDQGKKNATFLIRVLQGTLEWKIFKTGTEALLPEVEGSSL